MILGGSVRVTCTIGGTSSSLHWQGEKLRQLCLCAAFHVVHQVISWEFTMSMQEHKLIRTSAAPSVMVLVAAEAAAAAVL